MISSLLVTLREGLEAALIIGIIIGYLTKVGQRKYIKHIFLGTILGIIVSIIAAILFNLFLGGFEGRLEELYEGFIMLFAVIILTTMILWMNKQSKSIGKELEDKINLAINNSQIIGLVLLAFVAVLREGIEIVLFLNAVIYNTSSTIALIGGILGLITAIIIALIVFRTTLNLNLKKFFQYSGLFLIFIAAGMLALGIHELQEAGLIPIIIEHVWDINFLLNEKGVIGSFLKSLFGYNANPSLIEVLAYILFLTVSIKLFFFGTKKEVKIIN